MKTKQARTVDLSRALRTQASAVATEQTRGTPARRAVVATVGTDGTITTDDGIVALRLAGYSNPTVGDVIDLGQTSTGSWIARDRLANDGPLFKWKGGDQAVGNTNTMTTDADLVVQVAANAVYTIDGQLFVLGADPTSDVRIGYTWPAGASVSFGGPGPHTGITTGGGGDAEFVARQSVDGGTLYVPYGTTTSRLGVPLKGLLVTGGTAGAFGVQWARQTLGAGAVTIRQQSWLKLTRET